MSLFAHSYTGLPKNVVEDMVESRWRAERTLHEVTICIPGFEIFKQESERMKACVEEELSLQYFPSGRGGHRV